MHRTREVIDRLRDEGYSVSPGYLQYLLRERILRAPSERFAGAYVWREPDIDRLRSVLKRRERGPGSVARHENGR
ncbi:MAG: hypothetical protein R6V05_14760 [Candidatus Brocadiia bacterium]